jgi:type IV pilus assembly protein PilQ
MKVACIKSKVLSVLVMLSIALFFSIAFTAYAVEDTGKEPAVETGEKATTAEVPATEKPATGSDAEVIAEEEQTEDEAIGFKEDKVFLDFKDADIRDVLRVFARKAQINIIPSQKVQGTVTVKLADVPWEKALELILSQNNFVLQKDEAGIYKVFTQDEVAAVPLETKVYTLSYIKASDAKKILAPLLTAERGKVEADESGNKLIISDVPGKLSDLEKVILKLDSRIRQVSIEVRVFENSGGQEQNIGINWDILKEYKVSATSLKDNFQKTETNTQKYTDWKQTDTTQTLSPVQSELESEQKTSSIFGDSALTVPNRFIESSTVRTAILSADDFSLTLSALMSDSNAKLISSPKIATVDNRTAEIKVVRKIPIPQYSYNDQTGTYEISSFTFEEVGIKLNVTPQINQDEYITLEVKPSVTTQFDDKTFVISGGTIDVPIIDERSAETKVIVKSRETLVIGGLVSEDESKIIKKVPILGDIPLVKYLFSHKSTVKSKKDLIFFITPTLVEGEANVAAVIPGAAKTEAEIVNSAAEEKSEKPKNE